MRRTLVLFALAAAGAAPAAAATTTPAALRASIVVAGKAQHSVHYVSTSRTGSVTVTIVGDAGASQGSQRITYATGGKSGHATVLVKAGTAYFRADEFALAGFFGVAAAPAKTYANAWVVVPHASVAYASVAAAVTIGSTIDELGPKGTLTAAPATRIGGVAVVGVRSDTARNGKRVLDVLYARAKAPHVPVREVVSSGTSETTTAFESWNEPVSVTAPSHVVPVAKLIGGGAPAA
jgi:hypothetical protein